MAKQQGPQNVASKDDVIVITDLHGNTVMEIGSKEYTIRKSGPDLVLEGYLNKKG